MRAPAKPRRSNALQTVLTIVAVAAGALLVLLVILALVGGSLDLPREGMDPALAGLAVGEIAPSITAAGWVNGDPIDLEGKLTVVQGWFYDCPFCWQEAPQIAMLHQKYGDRVAFVALSPDPPETRPQVEEFVSSNKIAYPVGYGAINSLIGFEAQAFPAVWLVGPDGRVLWNKSQEGEQSLEEAILAALGGTQA